MSRPRKSTAILEASGAFDKNPQRRRSADTEPNQTGELGPPPDRLDEQEKQAWFEIVDMLQGGVLKRSDRAAVEMASRLFAKSWTGTIQASEGNTMLAIIKSLGGTPADRSRVSVPVAPTGNKFEE